MCKSIPKIGIQPNKEVTIPKILPKYLEFSFEEKIRVTMWSTNIAIKGDHPNDKINKPPYRGIPKKASLIPETHFKNEEIIDNSLPSVTILMKGSSNSNI